MKPDALPLFKVYCGIMTAIYGMLVAASVAVPLLGIQGLATEDLITFLVMGIIGLPFMMLFAYGFFLPQKKWAWVLGLIMIVIGLSSCCFWPICIPLLLKWIEPSCKEWFEHGDAVSGPPGADGW